MINETESTCSIHKLNEAVCQQILFTPKNKSKAYTQIIIIIVSAMHRVISLHLSVCKYTLTHTHKRIHTQNTLSTLSFDHS